VFQTVHALDSSLLGTSPDFYIHVPGILYWSFTGKDGDYRFSELGGEGSV
jgi:hypothetical protein